MVLAALPPLALIAWIATGQRGPARLQLPWGHVVETSTVLGLTTVSLTACLLLCAVTRVWGPATLGLVLIAIGGFWPIVQQNEYSGPVEVDIGTHGIHRNDALALGPGAVGVALLLVADRRRRVASGEAGALSLDD